MSKILNSEEANEICTAMCKSYNINDVYLEYTDYTNRVVECVQYLSKLKKFLWLKWKHKIRKVYFQAPSLEEAILELETRMKYYEERAEKTEKIRQQYAALLLDEELKKE